MLPDFLQERRKKSREFFKHYTDENVKVIILKNQTEQELIEQVFAIFQIRNQACIYPAKYIFCNIVYSYYLNKYFDLDFKECLSDTDVLKNSPIEYLVYCA